MRVKIPNDVGTPVTVADHTNSNHRSPSGFWSYLDRARRSNQVRVLRYRSFARQRLQPLHLRRNVECAPADQENRERNRLLAFSGKIGDGAEPRLVCAFTSDHYCRSSHQNLEIEPKRPGACVLQIQTHHIVEPRPTATFHLP